VNQQPTTRIAGMGRARSYRTIAWLYVIATLATHLFFLLKVRDRIIRGDPDFTVYYTAAKIIREGRSAQLYDAQTQLQVQREFTNDADIRHSPLPYIHPAFEALLFLPLTFVRYPNAFVLWNLLNLGLVFYIARLLRSFVFLKMFATWEIALGCLAFFPIFANFQQGQDAILLLLVWALGFRCLERGSDLLAGCWFGLGIFKYHLVLASFLILAIWRGRRLVFGFAMVALPAAVVSLAVVGWQGTLRYPEFVWHVLSHGGFGRIPANELPNLLGLLSGWPRLDHEGWAVQMAVFAGSIGLIIAIAGLRSVQRDRESFRLGFACAIIVALLVAYSTNTYDLSLLLLAVVITGDYCVRNLSGTSERLAVLLPIAPLLISPLWFWPWLKWQRINVVAAFLLLWLYFIRREVLRRRALSEVLSPPSFAAAAPQPASANKSE
jgi:hypothetical protein